jgi:hypothetical protein
MERTMTERRTFEHLAAHILEPVREDLSDSEYDLVRDDIIAIFENLDRKDMRLATRDDFQRFAKAALRNVISLDLPTYDRLASQLIGSFEGFTYHIAFRLPLPSERVSNASI